MGKLTKNQKLALAKIEAGKAYSLGEASQLVKDITYTKFDASLDIDVRLGVDPRKANQMVRGVVSLPHGTGKQVRVLVLCTPDAEAAAKEAGAEYVGGMDLVDKIMKENWMDFDVVIASPDMMGMVGRLGKVLGPRGLMPNPKAGTVTPDVAKAVTEAKAGKIEYRLDKTNIIHCPIGKASFGASKLEENFATLMEAVVKAKPSAAKGTYIKSCTVTSTMGVGVPVSTVKYGA